MARTEGWHLQRSTADEHPVPWLRGDLLQCQRRDSAACLKVNSYIAVCQEVSLSCGTSFLALGISASSLFPTASPSKISARAYTRHSPHPHKSILTHNPPLQPHNFSSLQNPRTFALARTSEGRCQDTRHHSSAHPPSKCPSTQAYIREY